MYFFKGIYQKSKILFWLFLSIILVLPVLSLLDIVLLKDEFSHIAFSDLTSPIYNLLATVALFFAAYYSRKISKRLYWGWLFLAIGQFSFTLGDIIWAVIELVLKIQLFPSIADAFYLLYYLLFLIGIIILPVKRLGSLEWFKRTLDVLIVMVVAILVDWIFIINPILKQGIGTSVLETIISIAYPVGDLLLMCALLIIIYYRSEHISIGSLVILGTSLIFTIIADSIYSHQSLLGIYSSGEILAYGWKISYVLVGLAAFSQIFSLELEKERDWLTDHILFRSEWVRRGVIIFPYFWVIGSYALLLGYYNQGSPINSYIISSGVGCILIFVIVRQIMASNENEHHLITIRNTLEQVNLQASELDRSNQKLRLEIIERNRVEDKLTHSKLHDALTGLANRDLFMDRLCHVVELSKRESNHFYSILFIDLDNFKTINDGFGQTTGDLALIEFGKRLIACTREPDTIARVSGDEFVILIESDLDENIGLKVAERIFNELLRPFHLINDKEIFLTCSIGIVHGISEYFNPEDLLRDANLAMYAAKDKGKAQTQIYNLSIGLPAFARFEIEGDMRTAIEKCEFYLDYQPIFSLAENKIVGMEALVRWRHPRRKVIMPGDFIDIAEKSGLIIPLGEWVLREALSQTQKWQAEYPELNPLWVSVNVSGKQIIQENFIERILAILAETEYDPHRLELEITETTYIESQSIVNNLLYVLREKGIRFMIDDFGTGYSSLGYLKNISVNTIKIDKSFVSDLLEKRKNIEIIKTIISMAQSLGIDTIAEGIENEEQLQILKSLNCGFGQGYFLSRPVNFEQIEAILNKQERMIVNSGGEKVLSINNPEL